MVSISRTAAKMFKEACKSKDLDPDDVYLRLFIQSNMAALTIDSLKNSTDDLHNKRGINIIIDNISNEWLSDAKIDYQSSDGATGFTVDTDDLPTAGSAGCGSCTGDAGCCG